MKKLLFLLLLPLTCFGMRYINLNDNTFHDFSIGSKVCFIEQFELKDHNRPIGLAFFVTGNQIPHPITGSIVYSLYMNNKELIYPTAGFVQIDLGRKPSPLIFTNIDLTQRGLQKIAGEFNVLFFINITFCLENRTNANFQIQGTAGDNIHPT